MSSITKVKRLAEKLGVSFEHNSNSLSWSSDFWSEDEWFSASGSKCLRIDWHPTPPKSKYWEEVYSELSAGMQEALV